MPGLGSEMHRADGTDRNPPSWAPWPARSGATVAFLPGERSAAERVAVRLFQRSLETWEYASLAGAPDDAHVEVGASAGQMYIEMRDPTAAAYRAYYYIRRTGEHRVLLNDGFHVSARNLHRRGFGLRIFHRQALAAAALRLDRIELVAGRRHDENGYYTWPRFGFDGALPARLRRMLPICFDGAQSVLDLMECEKGRAWWREHGATICVAFDLAAGSRSRSALERYVRARTNSAGGPKRKLEKQLAMSYCNAR